jgi:hypothetical protein
VRKEPRPQPQASTWSPDPEQLAMAQKFLEKELDSQIAQRALDKKKRVEEDRDRRSDARIWLWGTFVFMVLATIITYEIILH